MNPEDARVLNPEDARVLRHELATPLTGLLGFLELLEDLPSVSEDPVAADYVRRCTVSARRLRALIDERLTPPAGDH